MVVFPQLSTGVCGSFPIRRQRLTRTAVNDASDGRQYKLADTAGGSAGWDLRFAGLTDAEGAELSAFFDYAEGRLREFVFLDPAENLLAWSESLEESVWQRNGLLEVTPGFGDPVGTARASRLTNISGAALRIEQSLNVPAWFRYAFSGYFRNGAAEMVRSTATLSEVRGFVAGAEWRRALLSGSFSSAEEAVTFGLEIGPGQSVEVFGLQVEGQPGASGYRKTTSRSGVYAAARFDHDELGLVAEGPNRNSCQLRVVSL